MYQALKDFAGPISTVIASVTAAGITWRFAKRQLSIAQQQALISQQQARTAIDQLKNNTFERRYEIYTDIQQLLRKILNEAHEKNFSLLALAEFQVAFEQARFFFSDELCAWLDQVWYTHIPAFFNARRDQTKPEYLQSQLALLKLFEELPVRFRTELSLVQLKTLDVPHATLKL